MTHLIQGVHCAAATPVTGDGRPDLAMFAAHCRALLDEGCHGIALLGTTGEANSLAHTDRMALLDSAIDGGIDAGVMLPGTSAPAIPDTIQLTRHAVEAGAKGVVLLPPYYYKGVSDEGLFRFYARVIEGVADDRLRVVLYHIPQVTQVPISHYLIDRLMREFPGIVVGIKDSAGDIDHMVRLVRDFPDLAVLAGADPLMLPLLRAGGAGCITATSNLRADALRIIWDNWQNDGADDDVRDAQDRIADWRALTNAYVQLPTVKAMLARTRGDDGWLNVLPPLVPVTDEARADIHACMAKLET